MTAPAPPDGPPGLVSVVMPARDEERLIGHQLEALAGQDYEGRWELVVVDDGSSDRTAEAAERYADRIPGSRVVATPPGRRGLSSARNLGLESSAGELLAFCDADDVCAPGWLTALVEAAPGAHIVGGPLDHLSLNDHPLVRSWQPGVNERLLVQAGFLEHAPGGNCAVWRSTAEAVRWDEGLRFAGSDLDFCWRAQLMGCRLGFAPGALVHRRLDDSAVALARRYFRYGQVFPLLYRRFRGHGMPGWDRAETVASWRWLAVNAGALPRRNEHAGDWVRKAAFRAGRIVGSARYGVVFP